MRKIALFGPPCSRCHGRAARAARSRCTVIEGERVFFLAYLWRCNVCGREWCDADLERVNAKAAGAARTLSHQLSS